MQIQYYFLIALFGVTMPSHLTLGNSSVLPNDSQYIFISQPRPPRIYARAPSDVGVTKVLVRSKASILANENNYKVINFPDDSTIKSLNTESDDDLDTLPQTCFPHYYLHEKGTEDSTFVIEKCDGAISTARFIDNPVGYIYNVTVLAKDWLNFTLATMDIEIEVTEFNSKAPYLIQKQYSQEVLDTIRVGDLLTTITAGDNDTESYNKELYYFIQEKSKFDLDPWLFPTTFPVDVNVSTGEIHLTSSLANMSSPLYFRVGVADGGSPQRLNAVNMTVHIRNMSAPRNVQILNTTEISVTVCWSAPFQGVPKGYLISSQPRSPNVRSAATSPLNVTVQQLEMGTVGFLYGNEDKNFFSPQYCATLDGLIPHINYAVSIRGWADGKVSMARMPVITLTMKKSCFDTSCVHGVCQEQNSSPGFSCRCSEDYYGERCELTNPCYGDVCQNGGTCIRRTYEKQYECKCQPGFLGDKCEKTNICFHGNPCQNKGTCLINYNAEYRCLCPPRFNGTNCEIKDSDIFQTMCHSENSSYSEGEFQWPSTFKGNTAFLTCPFGVKDTYVQRGTELENNNTDHIVEPEYPIDDYEQVRVNNLSPQEQTNFSYSLVAREEDLHPMSRSKRFILKAEAEITIPYVPTNNQPRNGRHSRSVDSSVLTSDMSTGLPTITTIQSLEDSSQMPLSPSVKTHHDSRASARVGIPGATRACVEDDSGDTVWLEPNLTFCKNPNDVNIEIPTPAPEKITQKIFVASAKSLSHLVDKAISDKGIAKRMLDAISNLLNVNRSVFSTGDEDTYNATDSIMEIIDTYTSKVPLLPGQNIKLSTENLVVEAKVINIRDLPSQISFHPFMPIDEFDSLLEMSTNQSLSNESSDFIREKRSARKNNLDTIWIKVPKEALKNTLMEHARFQFVSFKDDKLFRSKNQKTSLNMPVVSATISNSHICNLDTPVQYRIPITDFDAEKMNLVCVFWDKTSKTWSSEGVSTRVVGESEIQCESNHLTSFSIVLDPIATPINPWHSKALSIISSVGLTISTVALVATIVTFALFRSLNRDRSGIIVMNLAIALLLLNVSFLGVILLKIQSWACITFATFLHYSVIASFTWMLLEAQNMYQLLVTVFPSAETHFMLKRLAFGWGVPFLFVVLALIWNSNVYVNGVSGYCIISPVSVPVVYFTTYFAPIVLVLVMNLVVFFKVTLILCQRRPSYGRNIKSSPEKPKHKSPPVSLAQFRGAVTIVALLGITWIAGIFTIGNLRIFLQYCFCVTTPLQGLIIFIVRVLQSAEARVAWKSFILTGSRRRRHPTQISSVRTHSSHNSSSANTQSTGVLPPSMLTSALRKFSLGTTISQNSFSGLNSKGRNSCHSNHSKNSDKCKKYSTNSIDNQSIVKREPVYSNDSEPDLGLTENGKPSRSSFAYSSLLFKEGDTHTIYESRLEDEPLKDLQQFLDTHPFFDKTRSNIDPVDQENIDVPNNDTEYIINESQVSLSKDENKNLSYQVYLLNERNISSTSNLSPQKKLSTDLLNKNMRRSLGSLLSKSKDILPDLQSDTPSWNLVRLPPDGTCDPEEYESPFSKPKELLNEENLYTDDPVSRNSISHCNSSTNAKYAGADIQQLSKSEVKDLFSNNDFLRNPKNKLSPLNMYDINDSNETENTEDIELKGLLVPVLNLPRAASYQNVTLNNIPLTNSMKRSASINEIDTLSQN